MSNLELKTTVDCKQGSVRAVRYNGEYLQQKQTNLL